MSGDRPIVLILGPTAGGKTALAVALARELPGGGECISADSMQVYRGMDIGTAKPTAAERTAAPHHLLDLIDPREDGFTVDRWLELAEQTIAAIRARGGWPIVVGGTNLYVQALLYGMFEGPPADAALRAELDAAPLEQLRVQLERVDPAAAARIHRNDRRRTVRALEVFAATGQPISEHQRQWFNDDHPPRQDIRIVGLDYPVESINRRINARVKAMMAGGFLEEVRTLAATAPGGLGRQAREALGYKQLLAHLKGEGTLEEAIEQIKIRTRRFAKQQRTWLRRFRAIGQSRWFAADEMPLQSIVDQCLTWLVPGQDSSSGDDDAVGSPAGKTRTSG
jgi:tRNA dimethylallyltransferase